jgi:hypothetical protein
MKEDHPPRFSKSGEMAGKSTKSARSGKDAWE